MTTILRQSFLVFGLFAFCVVGGAYAQMADMPGAIPAPSDESGAALPGNELLGGPAPEEIMLQAVQDKMKVELEKLSELDPTLPSLFFTQKQYTALRGAINGFERNVDIGTLETEDAGDLIAALPDQSKGVDVARDVELGGIVYFSANDWIVWVNSQRLTPKRIPPHIKDIKVTKDSVDLRWFDAKTRKIVPIRLKPNQRFNLDALMFLPG